MQCLVDMDLNTVERVHQRMDRSGKMEQTIPRDELKRLIKESVREVLHEERMGLCEILIPHVSKKELHEIHARFGSPGDYGENDFTDMTDWVKA